MPNDGVDLSSTGSAPGATGNAAPAGNGSGTPAAPATTTTPELGVSLSPPAPASGNAAPDASQPGLGHNGGPAWDPTYKPMLEAKGWLDADGSLKVNEVLKGYQNAETLISQRGSLAPKTADEYQLDKPDNAGQLGYNDDFAKWFKGAAHKIGLSQEQAKGLHDAYVGWAGESLGQMSQQQQAQLSERIQTTANTLTKEWGSPNTPAFSKNLEMARRAISQLGLKDSLTALGVVVNVNGKEMVTDAAVIGALAKVGEGMYAEDTLYGDPATMTNPFDPETLDMTAQSRIFREDKERARSLIMSLPPEKRARYQSTLARLNAK